MKVLDALRAKPEGKALADRLVNEIRVRALAKLEHTKDLFPHFTDHTIRHAEGVLAVLDWLVPDSLKKALNQWELYFLVAAAYLHDIGMVEGCPGTPSGEEWDKFLQDYEARQRDLGVSDPSAILLEAKREFVRDHHHERSEQYIRDHWIELGLRASDNPGEGQVVGRLALGHREVDLSDRTLFGEVPFGVNQLIRRDLLAAYLRLADELDTTAYRTPWAEYEVVTTYDEDSALEWAKHLSLFGVSCDQGVIVLSGECRDHGVYLRLSRLHADMRAKLADIRRMLPRPYATGDEFFVADPLPYHDVDLSVEHVGYLPIEIKFELQDREIIELIMGQRLYGDQTACIRELLQNAVDTCREAREQRPAGWVARIELSEEDEGSVVSVVDNGMGMDEYIVRQYFSRVGISYYTSREFQGTFKPISEFGIGVLSCFMLADRIEVDSKREGQEPIHLEIRSLTEPFVPKRGSRTEPGTAVRLHLKPDAIGSFDLPERVAHFAKHVEFPIKIRTCDGEVHTVADKGLAPDVKDLAAVTETRYMEYYPRYWTPKNIAKHHCALEANGVRLGVTLLDPLVAVWALKSGNFASRFSQQGFVVGPLTEEFSKFARSTWCELSLVGERVVRLTADRTRAGEAADDTWRLAAELYSEAVEELYERTVETKTAGVWWRYHFTYYPARLRHVPQALLSAFAQAAEFCTITREGFRGRRAHELRKWSGPLYWVQPEDHGQLWRIRDLLPAEVCVVAMPIMTWGWDEHGVPWCWDLVARSDVRGPGKLGPDLGLKVRSASIDGHRRRFVDAGLYLGSWRLSLGWLRPYRETVFDACHPFSQVLLKSCTGELPRRSSLVLGELFRSAYSYSPQQLQERQREVFETLKDDGLVLQSATLSPAPERPPSRHKCPYRG